MTTTIVIGKDAKTVPTNGTIESAIRSLDLKPDAFLYLVDGKPTPMDTPITDGMNIKAIKVASGG